MGVWYFRQYTHRNEDGKVQHQTAKNVKSLFYTMRENCSFIAVSSSLLVREVFSWCHSSNKVSAFWSTAEQLKLWKTCVSPQCNDCVTVSSEGNVCLSSLVCLLHNSHSGRGLASTTQTSLSFRFPLARKIRLWNGSLPPQSLPHTTTPDFSQEEKREKEQLLVIGIFLLHHCRHRATPCRRHVTVRAFYPRKRGIPGILLPLTFTYSVTRIQ